MPPGTRLALAADFDPQSLPDLAPPVPGGRPWQWLKQQSAEPHEREARKQRRQGRRADARPTPLEAYLDRFVAGHGTCDPYQRDLVVRPLPAEQVIASHLAQDVVFDIPGAGTTLRLSAAGPDAASGAYPFAGPVAIVGTFPPAGRAVAALGHDLRKELQASLDARGIGYWSAVAADNNRRWVERALIVDYTDGSPVRFAAEYFLQPFLTVWRCEDGRSILEVIDLANPFSERVVARGHATLGRLAHRPCPMLPGAGSADLCKMFGGPWTSNAIHAAHRWESKRARMIDSLGCDTCGDGAVKVCFGWIGSGRHSIGLALEVGTQSRHDELVPAEPVPGGRA